MKVRGSRFEVRGERSSPNSYPFPRTSNLEARLIYTMVMILAAKAAAACPVCFGDPNSPMTKGTDNAVWFLLGVIGFVQIGFVALFVTFWRRARALRRHRESFQLLEGGAR